MQSRINYKALTDESLIDLIKSSDHGAFSEIFRRYNEIIFSFTYRKLQNIEASQDLIQEIFTDLWGKRDSINIPGNFQAFLFTVLKNQILDQRKHMQVSQRYLDEFIRHAELYYENSDHLVRTNDLSLLIEREIAALPEKLRVVFELSRKTNLTRKEIAEHLVLPEETIKTRMRRALKILRDRLGIIILFI